MAPQHRISTFTSRKRRIVVYLLFAFLTGGGISVAASSGYELTAEERMTFLESLDLGRPDLASIRDAYLADGNAGKACSAYIAYFRTKKITSSLLTDWSAVDKHPGYDAVEADKILQGLIWDGINTHDVSKEGLDWHNTPVSGLTRFPIFGVLREAIHHTAKSDYTRYVVEHVKGYDTAYPIAQFIGKSTQNGWINYSTPAKPWYWNMIAHRLNQLAETIALIRTSPHVSDDELAFLLRRTYLEANYLRTEMPYWVDRRHNCGLMMIKAMAQVCEVLADFKKAPAWKQQNIGLVDNYLKNAFYPDGMCVELSTAYCIGASKDAQQLAAALAGENALEGALTSMNQLVTCQIGLSDPTGRVPSFGDLHAGRLDRALYQPALDQLEMRWAASIGSDLQTSTPGFLAWPPPGQQQWSGYYTMRSGWHRNARYLAIDCGPWGTNHQHGDRLSFVITAYGEQFIIDPSGTQYASQVPNALVSRQSAGFLHNTITVDGVDEFKSQGSADDTGSPLQNVWLHGKNYTHFSGRYSFAPLKKVTWERRIVFASGEYWLLQDVLTGSEGEVTVEQNFQFNDDIAIEHNGRQISARAPNGARLMLVPLEGDLQPTVTKGDQTPHLTYWPDGKSGGSLAHGRGWTGRSGPELIPAPAVTFVGKVTLPATLTLALVPVSPQAGDFTMPQITSRKDQHTTIWHLSPAARINTRQSGICQRTRR